MKRGPRRSSLFWRIYSTVVLTVLAGTAVGVAATWFVLQQRSEHWVSATLETLEERNDALVDVLDDRAALEDQLETLRGQLNTRVLITDPRGRPLVGRPEREEMPPPRHLRRHARALKHGRPLVLDRGQNRRLILYPLMHPDSGRVVAIASVRPEDPPRGMAIAVSALTMLLLLGLGARSLSRSLTSRLRRVESSAERIANGELSHRVVTPDGPPADELDDLALSFNDMTDKLEALIQGQRVLLANVSHELRTPIARVRVVLEILEGRLERLGEGDDPRSREHLERLRKGLTDIGRDTHELETLITDLLTSGRLELSAAGGPLDVSPVRLDELAETMAERFDACVEAVPSPAIQGDRLLLERLLSNLLSNARRACPDGALTIDIAQTPEGYRIAVEDEGHGIAPEDRDAVFEPFRRLDEARSRDAGGVGLGLYLCRQIARAHGGDVYAQGRQDGARGARMVVELPKTPPRRG
ncbi:MAG: sensor histidine kinase [Nannocystaceae bacterium]|nr:ATP-binding protein [bacterium]